MNLKPAELWIDQLPDSLLKRAIVWPTLRADRIQFIRQIQADALRFAAEIVRSGNFLHDDAPDARFGKAASAAIERKANQLDPRLKGGDATCNTP